MAGTNAEDIPQHPRIHLEQEKALPHLSSSSRHKNCGFGKRMNVLKAEHQPLNDVINDITK